MNLSGGVCIRVPEATNQHATLPPWYNWRLLEVGHMSIKRGSETKGSSLGSGEIGSKVDRQRLFDDLKKRADSGLVFTPVDVALSIGAAEPQVVRSLLGLAAEGAIEKVELGHYKAAPVADLDMADFIKLFSRASKMDATRMRDIAEIDRLKKNNDVMRVRLVRAQAERDHYLAACKSHNIDPGPLPPLLTDGKDPSSEGIALPAVEPAVVAAV